MFPQATAKFAENVVTNTCQTQHRVSFAVVVVTKTKQPWTTFDVKHAHPIHSLRTMLAMSITMIRQATAFHVKTAHSATKVPDFVKIARPAS
jgi:hypothetical protein